MTKLEKLESIRKWLVQNIDDEAELSKTGSIYFTLQNNTYDGIVKISNHQLIEGRFKNYLGNVKRLDLINYEIIENGDNYNFADLNKYYWEYGKTNKAPSYWIVANGNFSVQKIIDVIQKMKDERA